MSKNKNHNQEKFSYKDSLNLLKTDFSMRANAVKREPEIQKFWSCLLYTSPSPRD